MKTHTKNGKEYVSVTTVLQLVSKPALVQWSANCAVDYIANLSPDKLNINDNLQKARTAYKEIGKQAMDIGSQTHRLIHSHIVGHKDQAASNAERSDLSVQNCFKVFLSWEAEKVAQNGLKWLKTEFEVFDETLCYSGQVDALCEIDGKQWILDFKCSKALYPETGYQLAAYGNCANIKNLAALRLNKETDKYQFKKYSYDINFDIFEHYLAIWHISKLGKYQY